LQELAANWALQSQFEPTMDEAQRGAKKRNWQLAINRVLHDDKSN